MTIMKFSPCTASSSCVALASNCLSCLVCSCKSRYMLRFKSLLRLSLTAEYTRHKSSRIDAMRSYAISTSFESFSECSKQISAELLSLIFQ